MGSNVLASIIIATYNAEEYLERCLQSIVNQNYSEKEIIIIDGGSTDQTLSIIDAYKKSITYWHSKSDNGIYDAWNSGISASRGDWICFLGADDYFLENDVISRMISLINNRDDNQKLLFYGKVRFAQIDGSLIETLNTPPSTIKNLTGDFIFHSGAFHHRNLFEQYGQWPTEYRICGDRALLYKVFLDDKAEFLPEITTINYQYGGISSNLKTEIEKTKEILTIQKIYNTPGMYLAKIYFELLIYIIIDKVSPVVPLTTINKLRNFYRFLKKRPAVY